MRTHRVGFSAARWMLCALASLALTACGGGGSSGSSGSSSSSSGGGSSPTTYSVGGSISGLSASGLVLEDNGGNNLTVNNGQSSFTFTTMLANGAAYDVTVATQPTGETCTPSSNTGTISSANVSNVSVACTANTYTITGSATGLTSAGLKLQFYTGGQVLSVAGAASGSASYTDSSVPYGSSILASFISQQPGWETCTQNSGDFSGTVAQNVTGEDLTCTADTASASTVTMTGATLQGPTGVAVDSSGDIFVADTSASKIYEISGGVATELASTYTFSSPYGIAVDSAGNVYVANSGGNDILEIVKSSGAVNTLGSSHTFLSPKGVAVDSQGNVFATDSGHNEIVEIASTGTVSVVAGSTVAGCVEGNGPSAEFDDPTGIAVDSAGNLYVADANNSVIREVTSVGTNDTVSILAGGGGTCSGATTGTAGYLNGTGTAAEFEDPMGVAVDSAGNVYVADNLNNAIREVSPQGVVTTVAASADPTNGTTNKIYAFNGPWGISVGTSTGNLDDLYVGDFGSKTIVELAP